MALRGRNGKDVKKSSYYVWYLGAREAKSVDAMPAAIDYLLEREQLQEPFKVTLQVSSKGLKIIQTVHPGGSTRSAVKHLVPSHAVLAAVKREDVVAATLHLPNPATNNLVHVHAYRCDSVETAELLGGQLKILASYADVSLSGGSNGLPGRIGPGVIAGSLDTRLRSNLGSDGRSTRESESSEGSGELRHAPAQVTSIYESLAAELRAKLGRGNADTDAGPILLPPRDYDTVHRARGNLTGIELRRCLNQTIVGPSVGGSTSIVERTQASSNGGVLGVNIGNGTRSAASSGIGSDSAATPPPYHGHHPLGPRPSRPTRDSSSDEDWSAPVEEPDYIADQEQPANVTLPRLPHSPDRAIPASKVSQQLTRGILPEIHENTNNRHIRRSAEHRQRSPSPQYQPRLGPGESISSPRERFHDAKEMFRQMEREAIVTRPIHVKINNRNDGRPIPRSELMSRQLSHEEPLHVHHKQRQSIKAHGQPILSVTGASHLHERLIRRSAIPHHHPIDPIEEPPILPQHQQNHQSLQRQNSEEKNCGNFRGRTRSKAQLYAGTSTTHQQAEPELTRPRPRSFYEVPMAARELRGPRNLDSREMRDYSRSFHSTPREHSVREQDQISHMQHQQQRPRPFTYGELAEHERYPGLDRENSRAALEIGNGVGVPPGVPGGLTTPARYRHSYAEPPRLGLAALNPY